MTLVRLLARTRSSKRYAWGFGAQALSSSVSLALTLLAGRVLGPSGLGVVFIGFAMYTLVVSLQRSLISTPLVSDSSALPQAERAEAASSGLTVMLIWAAASALAAAAVGWAIGGPIGEGLLMFAP